MLVTCSKGHEVRLYTATELAGELGVIPQAVRTRMARRGIAGMPIDANNLNSPRLYTEADLELLREDLPRGPKTRTALAQQ